MTAIQGPLKVDLAERRLNAGHSLRSLGRELGLAGETIRRAEEGEPVTPAVAHKIATFFELEVREIWNLNVAETAA